MRALLCEDWQESSTQGPPYWEGHRMSSFLCVSKILFFLLYYQYFTSAPRGALEVNGLPANGRRWRWDLDFSKQTWRIGAPVNKGSHTHPSMPWPWSTAGKSCFDWPTEICDGPQKHPWRRGREGCVSTEECFIYTFIYSFFKSDREHYWPWQAFSWCLLFSKSFLTLKDWSGSTQKWRDGRLFSA